MLKKVAFLNGQMAIWLQCKVISLLMSSKLCYFTILFMTDPVVLRFRAKSNKDQILFWLFSRGILAFAIIGYIEFVYFGNGSAKIIDCILHVNICNASSTKTSCDAMYCDLLTIAQWNGGKEYIECNIKLWHCYHNVYKATAFSLPTSQSH